VLAFFLPKWDENQRACVCSVVEMQLLYYCKELIIGQHVKTERRSSRGEED
jgi:hypothetical protein